jgi:hypothetical protein
VAITKVAASGLLTAGAKYNRAVAKQTPAPWSRPTDWVTLPTVNVGDQKMVGLYAVYPHDSNFVALTAAGAYTVDWGDGTATENIATGVQAQHNYVFSALSSGTLTSGGYRQAVVTITMQGAAVFTSLNLLVKHTQATLNAYGTGWLDLCMAGSSVNSLTLGGTTPVVQRMLQRFEYVGSSALTTFSSKFSSCRALGSVLGTAWTSSGTNFSTMFSSCTSLQAVPLFNTASGTNFSSMFSGCSSLQTVPLLNTASGTNFSTMFNSCTSLQTVPLFNTGAGTDFSSMFASCSSLQTVPLLNTAAGTNFSSMFTSCPSLATVPLFNTAAGTDFTSMFNGCTSLPTVPLFNTSAGTTFTTMFNNCSSLQTVPLLVVTAGTTFTNMFNACPSLAVGALSGTSKTINYSGCKLSATEINSIYTNLASGVTAQTVTTATNWGTSTSTASIATAKGWTVA